MKRFFLIFIVLSAIAAGLTYKSLSQQSGRLYVAVEPQDAHITLVDHDRTYSPGIELPSGTYRVAASREGFDNAQQSVEVAAGEKNHVSLTLKPKLPDKGRVYIDAVPSDAVVKIMNIKPKYHDGIKLPAASYLIRVEKPGYKPKDTWVTLSAGQHLKKRIEIQKKQSHNAGQAWLEKKTKMTFVWIPGGRFDMGCSPDKTPCNFDEKPVHVVSLDGFWIGACEVSNEQFVLFLNAVETVEEKWFDPAKIDADSRIFQDDRRFKVEPGYAKYPVTEVSWFGARAFAQWLSENSAGKFCLPTESQWEYACRIRPSKAISSAASLRRQSGCSRRIEPIGSLKTSRLGIFDMIGNVWEWCEDHYDPAFYQTTRATGKNPVCRLQAVTPRVIRSGSWCTGWTGLRMTNRNGVEPHAKNNDLGFRLVREE